MGNWHGSFYRMRVADGPRDWMTWSEFDGLIRTLGIVISRKRLAQAIATAPPVKVKNAKRYERRHVELVSEYARKHRLCQVRERPLGVPAGTR